MKKMFVFILLLFIALSNLTIYSQEDSEIKPVYFSFASDDFHNGPTFEGAGERIWGKAEVDLVIDTNEDYNGGQVQFFTVFTIEAELYDYFCISFGNQWLHVWKLNGIVNFYHRDNLNSDPLILEITFKEAVVTSWSSSSNRLGETMTIQDSEYADRSVLITPYNQLKYITGTNLIYSEDFAFTLTNVVSIDSNDPVPVLEDGLIESEWKSEGSFSASAFPSLITPDNN